MTKVRLAAPTGREVLMDFAAAALLLRSGFRVADPPQIADSTDAQTPREPVT